MRARSQSRAWGKAAQTHLDVEERVAQGIAHTHDRRHGARVRSKQGVSVRVVPSFGAVLVIVSS